MRYDAIIIGAVSAGCVLVSQLSEDSGRPVLLLEEVMPEIPRANTNATVIMVAERAADLIRQGYQ